MADLINEFSWSISQAKEAAECKRRYHYTRYGSWEGWPTGKGDMRAKQLYILKNLTRKEIWVGSVIHDAIKNILENIKGGYTVDYEVCERRLVDKMLNDIQSSKQKLYHKYPKRNTGFFEDEYGSGIPQAQLDNLIEFAKDCLRNFFKTTAFEKLRKIKRDQWLTIDESKPSSFIFEGTKIYVKLDAAIKEGERVMIYDWKTSRKEDVDYSAQLACYLIFATKQWNCKPHDVDVFEVNVAVNKTTLHHGIAAKIEWFEDYMRNSINAIKNLLQDTDTNLAFEDDFPKINDLRYCTKCNYLRVCKPAVLPAGELPH